MKKNIKIFIIAILVIIANVINLYAQNNDDYKFNAKIAKPIIKIEKDDKINMKINKENFPNEYSFSVLNYNEDSINEVDSDYYIELKCSENNFPINYILYDCDLEKQINFFDGKSETFKITKNIKEKRNFKVIFNWKNGDYELADDLKIDLKLKCVQNGGEKI